MSFYFDMHARYCPEIPMREFSDIINAIEVKLFDEHHELLRQEDVLSLTIKEIQKLEHKQNIAIEEVYRKTFLTGK